LKKMSGCCYEINICLQNGTYHKRWVIETIFRNLKPYLHPSFLIFNQKSGFLLWDIVFLSFDAFINKTNKTYP